MPRSGCRGTSPPTCWRRCWSAWRSALEAGESVKISGFGTFSVRQKGRRVGRNPKTGVEVPILPRRVLVFRSEPVLKRARQRPAVPAGLDDDDDGGHDE